MKTKIKKSIKTAQQFISLSVTVVLIFAIFSCIPTYVSAKAEVIRFNEPAILANKGDTVKLDGYSVEFSDGEAFDGITWKYNGNEISSLTVEEAAVYPLIASANGKSKNVYIVSKNKTDDEYVLYYNDFSSGDAIKDWNKIADESLYTINDGKLTITDTTGANIRAYLPAWLSDFANYRIDAVATQTDAKDASRWISFIYRAGKADTTGTPYYHMAVRNNMASPATSTTGGIECCSNTGNWNYYKSASYTEKINGSKFYTFSVLAKDSVVQYQVDGNTVIHLDELPEISEDIRGGIGLQANSSKLVVDSIKISVLEKKPVYTEPEAKQILQFVENPVCNILNPPTNIAIIDSMQTLEGLQDRKPSNALMYVDSYLNVNSADGVKITSVADAMPFLGKNIIPAFYINNNAAADALAAYLESEEANDVLIVSSDTEVLKYVRTKYPVARTAVDFSSAYPDEIGDEELLKIRREVTSANSLIAVLPVSHADADKVSYLQNLGVTVWIMDFYTLNDTDAVKMITSGATGIITYNYKRINECFNAFFEENTLVKTPLIIGHRGNPTQAPENSISGYLKAFENGSDVVETDIMLTKDGKIIIMHDDKITRTTSYNGSTPVTQMTLEEIKKYNLWGENDKYKTFYPEEKVPTLEEFFTAFKDIDCKIFLEIKTANPKIIQPTVDLINKFGYEDRIFVICFNSSQIQAFRKAMPTVGTGFLTGVTPFGSVSKMHESLYNSYLTYHGINSTFNPSFGGLNVEMYAALRHRGITCWPWTYTISSAADFNKAFIWGIDGLTTNDAQYSKQMAKKLVTSENKINLIADDSSDGPESRAEINVDMVTYARESKSVIGDENAFVTFIEGADVIKYENGTITALKEGIASFMIGYKTETANGTPYVIYSQPFAVDVKNDDNGGVITESRTIIIYIIIAVLAVVIIACTIYIVIKKRKSK